MRSRNRRSCQITFETSSYQNCNKDSQRKAKKRAITLQKDILHFQSFMHVFYNLVREVSLLPALPSSAKVHLSSVFRVVLFLLPAPLDDKQPSQKNSTQTGMHGIGASKAKRGGEVVKLVAFSHGRVGRTRICQRYTYRDLKK